MHTQKSTLRPVNFSKFIQTIFRIILLIGLLGITPAPVFANAPEPQPYLVKNISEGRYPSQPENLTDVNGTLFFTAVSYNSENSFYGLWRSDGTESGTVFVKELSRENYTWEAWNFIAFQNELYFTAFDETYGYELWRSDGTEEGTLVVKDIYPGGYDSNPMLLTVVEDRLFFVANDGIHGEALWSSDGTNEGTNLVKDIIPGTGSTPLSNLTAVNDKLFFTTNDGIHGEELWVSDGTADGTVLVKDIYPGETDSINYYDEFSFTAYDNNLFFFANDGVHGYELWRSDGTTDGTMMVKDISLGANNSIEYYYNSSLVISNDMLFFQATDSISGRELWRSDGTEDGTVLVKNIYPGGGGSYPQNITAVNNTLFFTAEDDIHGRELWRSDGTEEGTVLVKDITTGQNNTDLEELTAVNNTLYFIAYQDAYGYELWRSDGTDEGTHMVKDLLPGSGSSMINRYSTLTNVGGQLFFVATDIDIYNNILADVYLDGPYGIELWALGYFSYMPLVFAQ
ncbi:MAG: hypothetical protein CL609_03870 [Anaerolineaceae bacterium]|nr:hypothetical protein [Anaerolineaceae bacterium]